MRTETFQTPEPPRLLLRIPSGSVELEAVEGAETRVDLEGLNDPGRAAVEEATVDQVGDEIRVELGKDRGILVMLRSPKVRARIVCPVGTRLRADVVAADLTVRGRLGPSEIRSVSADVELDEIDGDLELKTVSGDAVARRVAGSASLNTVSGDLKVRELGGSASAKTISGDLELDAVSSGSLTVQSVSGDVKVGIVRGAGVWMDLKSVSGDTRSDLDAADGPTGDETSSLEVRAKTVSGDIRLVRA